MAQPSANSVLDAVDAAALVQPSPARKASAIRAFRSARIHALDMQTDFVSFFAMIVGSASLMFKSVPLSWFSLFLGVSSYLNPRPNLQTQNGQIMAGIAVSLLAIATNYLVVAGYEILALFRDSQAAAAV
ncbi:hypothetical protein CAUPRSCDRAFT_11747 [Caulochytrium protostelioides]|uniref:Uncharacterized protein n=1 Tax=Caulochytrium protostelioides TaxID=1555241 RepID=A0A4P9WVB9_9FUNG|nr:hypothetical protein CAUPRSCDRAFT_11747 [Caulochytrium protostelioides]